MRESCSNAGRKRSRDAAAPSTSTAPSPAASQPNEAANAGGGANAGAGADASHATDQGMEADSMERSGARRCVEIMRIEIPSEIPSEISREVPREVPREIPEIPSEIPSEISSEVPSEIPEIPSEARLAHHLDREGKVSTDWVANGEGGAHRSPLSSAATGSGSDGSTRRHGSAHACSTAASPAEPRQAAEAPPPEHAPSSRNKAAKASPNGMRQCGTPGCILADKHSCPHSNEVPCGGRRSRPVAAAPSPADKKTIQQMTIADVNHAVLRDGLELSADDSQASGYTNVSRVETCAAPGFKFKAYCKRGGKQKKLGSYDLAEQAALAVAYHIKTFDSQSQRQDQEYRSEPPAASPAEPPAASPVEPTLVSAGSPVEPTPVSTRGCLRVLAIEPPGNREQGTGYRVLRVLAMEPPQDGGELSFRVLLQGEVTD